MNTDSRQNRLSKILGEHPALLASAVYFAASAIGMFYSWAFLRHFGVNVFNFAQIGDFLLASLKEPMTWLLVLLAILLMIFDNAMSRRHQKKSKTKWMRWYGSPKYRSVNYLASVTAMLVFLFAYAESRALDFKSGDGDVVAVKLAEAGAPKTAMLLGTTGQFIFLYDVETGGVDIHPNENIQTISLVVAD